MKLIFNFEVPQTLRAMVRARELGLIVIAAVVGAFAGVVVGCMGFAVDVLHSAFYSISIGQRLSGLLKIDPLTALLVPTLGGVVFGAALLAVARWRPGREVDPIEANALHGGQMSSVGSLIVALQTIWSSGVGASVGLEAGYTQLASGIGARIGRAFRLRRRDQRILVGCGAAGAIAGAFGAPLAGAFYAFELVIGSYSTASLAPVGVAALLGYVTTSFFHQPTLGLGVVNVAHLQTIDLAIAAGFGVLAAGMGIALMRGVALCETALNVVRVPGPVRPAIGGLAVGAMAIVTPEVLSSGHGAIHLAGVLDRPLSALALLLLLKSAASIVSLGCGFRGGLFFASLLLGAVAGQLFALSVSTLWPSLYLDAHAYSIIGMGALSVAVIGGPMTMTFIALETTGDFWLTTGVLIAVIVAAQVTRETFGYSFATWRFHLRGETIRSAADVGWIRELTVRRMMRPDVRTVPARTTVARFRLVYPLGSISHVIAVDEDKRYAGLLLTAELHAIEIDERMLVQDLLHFRDTTLLPTMTIKDAVLLFDKVEAEALAVTDAKDKGEVVGLLTEAYALRRYTEELEQRRRDLLGE